MKGGERMKNLFYRLLIYLDSANETDTNYNIAWYMAHHLSAVANMGISKLARERFVSPATISRFCRALGYENYAHLILLYKLFLNDVHIFLQAKESLIILLMFL